MIPIRFDVLNAWSNVHEAQSVGGLVRRRSLRLQVLQHTIVPGQHTNKEIRRSIEITGPDHRPLERRTRFGWESDSGCDRPEFRNPCVFFLLGAKWRGGAAGDGRPAEDRASAEQCRFPMPNRFRTVDWPAEEAGRGCADWCPIGGSRHRRALLIRLVIRAQPGNCRFQNCG